MKLPNFQQNTIFHSNLIKHDKGKMTLTRPKYIRKKLICNALILFLLLSTTFAAELLKPYILIGESGLSVEKTSDEIIKSMFMNNFDMLGQYTFSADQERMVMIVSNELLQAALNLGPSEASFLGGIRIGITAKDKMTYISCQDPEYWARAYFREDYPKVHLFIEKFKKDLLSAMPKFRMRSNTGFGSDVGLREQELITFHFDKKNTPHFEDKILLRDYTDHSAAVKALTSKLETSTGYQHVFTFELPGKKIVLYGISQMATPGDRELVTLLDQGPRKNTAFLPLEILIIDHSAYLLDPLYRLPLSFPDMDKRSYKKLRKLVPRLLDNLDLLLK